MTVKSIEISAKNVDQAIEIGLFKLDAKKEDVKIEILEQGGLFDKAKVRISLGESTQNEKKVEEIVKGLIESMNISCFASVQERENTYLVNLSGEDVGVLIGKHGEIMDNLQFIISNIVNKNKHGDEYKRVVFDSQGYRDKRENALKELATRMASKAIREGRVVKLEPMKPNERRIIHTALQNNERITTESKGDEPYRYLTIIPKERRDIRSKKPFAPQESTDGKEETSDVATNLTAQTKIFGQAPQTARDFND